MKMGDVIYFPLVHKQKQGEGERRGGIKRIVLTLVALSCQREFRSHVSDDFLIIWLAKYR